MSRGPLDGVAVLVTGGAGFIGSHVAERLAAGGARVRVLDNLVSGRWSNLDGASAPTAPIERLEGDLRDVAACAAACRGVALVFHLAALGSVPRSLEDPAETVAVNVGGTANLLAAARRAGVRRLVYSSSSSVYGDSTASPKREGEEGAPLSPYAASKKMDEELAALFSRHLGLDTVGLRYFNVYGARQDPAGPYAAVIPRFFAAAFAGEPAVIHGDGGQSRDFTHVDDVVRANCAAALAGPQVRGRVYNVGSGRHTTVLELEERIRSLVGGAPPPRFEPERAGDVRHSLADTARAAAELGFRARIDLLQGLSASLLHYRETGVPARPASRARRAPPTAAARL